MSVLLREIDSVLSAVNGLYSNIDNEIYNYHTYTTNDSYNVEIPLVGISKESLTVEIKDSVLYVSAKTKIKSYFSKDYQKSFQLSKDADVDNVSAKLENGLLTIKVLKIKPEKRTVNVSVV